MCRVSVPCFIDSGFILFLYVERNDAGLALFYFYFHFKYFALSMGTPVTHVAEHDY